MPVLGGVIYGRWHLRSSSWAYTVGFSKTRDENNATKIRMSFFFKNPGDLDLIGI